MNEWVRRYRQFALVLVFATAFAEGFSASSGVAARVLVALTFASATTLWCGLDAHLHGKLFLRSFGWLMMFTWPVAAAAHLVWTRGARGILTYILAALACMAAVSGGLAAASLLAP